MNSDIKMLNILSNIYKLSIDDTKKLYSLNTYTFKRINNIIYVYKDEYPLYNSIYYKKKIFNFYILRKNSNILKLNNIFLKILNIERLRYIDLIFYKKYYRKNFNYYKIHIKIYCYKNYYVYNILYYKHNNYIYKFQNKYTPYTNYYNKYINISNQNKININFIMVAIII